VSLSRAGLATSGDTFQHLEIDGIRYSHILDPRTGLGLTNQIQVTVISRDGMSADSLATAVSVLGPAAGLALVEQTPKAAALIARRPGQTVEMLESRRLGSYLAK
jgi:thiamine biosynthesis lipoprotein